MNYRYVLTRTWAHTFDKYPTKKPCMLFVMLNPSTADETVDDPTIRRCINFAKRECMRSLQVVNLYAMRATDPRELFRAIAKGEDAVGPENFLHIRAAARDANYVVVAWGSNGDVNGVHLKKVVDLILNENQLYCLGTTKSGQPKHPLYIKAAQPLIPYVWKEPQYEA